MEKVILKALIRILENQSTIKAHIGIIKHNEYYSDNLILGELNEALNKEED